MGTSLVLDLTSAHFRNKVSGCWIGKNCGGTLGAPLELALGQADPFDICWYPELPEGGIPNDDLEIQLIWLKALEERGPHLRASDLAHYWLDHICYNFDEYGLHKTNLRLGLRPPVSGAYNNWFRDCMGSPIRSEIWACVAPGVPRLAARYAYEDALCDHAGGEGVFGEMFNAAIESAAFVVADCDLLLDIALSYIPVKSKTAQAIRAARAAHAAGVDWLEARRRVLAATPHYVAQYAPINLGFQVIGWLYGSDFGDALCKTVNCGYDTDCTGATLGSILGILAGQHGLPARWTAPLGEQIATNESWGGLAHLSDGANPVPTTLSTLTERVCQMAKKVLGAHGFLSDEMTVQVEPEALFADTEIRELWTANPWTISYPGDTVSVQVEYPETPVGVPGSTTTIRTIFKNAHPDALRLTSTLQGPTTWDLDQTEQLLDIPAGGERAITWTIPVPSAATLENTNQLQLATRVQARPAQPTVPIVIIGAHHYRVSGPYQQEGLTDEALLDHPFAPETRRGDLLTAEERDGCWEGRFASGNELPAGDLLAAGGALYIQAYLFTDDARSVWMGVMASCLRKLWVNGEQVARVAEYRPFRPSPLSAAEEGFAHVRLNAGWNEVFIKCVRSTTAPAFDAHLLFSTDDRLHHGLPDILHTRFPYEV